MDTTGIVALWGEGLLAQKVLAGQTKGYRNHPQLNRFRLWESPQKMMGACLSQVVLEAEWRGYNFQKDKTTFPFFALPEGLFTMTVTSGQLEYEKAHPLKKLQLRDPPKICRTPE